MAIQAVTGGTQCGAQRHATEFSSTGLAKGHYPVYVCDRPKHLDPRHKDSAANKSWSEQ